VSAQLKTFFSKDDDFLCLVSVVKVFGLPGFRSAPGYAVGCQLIVGHEGVYGLVGEVLVVAIRCPVLKVVAQVDRAVRRRRRPVAVPLRC
jgi:hypothetical protein